MSPHRARALTRLLAAASLTALACRSPLSIRPDDVPSSLSAELDDAALALGPNDVLRVGVYGHPELSTPLTSTASGAVGTRVDAEGNLSLPLAGDVRVGGMSLAEAREAVRAAYAVYLKDPRVDVSVVEYGARRFYLYGEVREPGAYPIDRPLTLYQALALGKGFTTAARRDEVVLLRGGPGSLEVHAFDGEDLERAGMFAVLPDDFLFVRRSRAGRFSQEVLPVLQGISSSLASVATLLLIDDQLED